MKINRLSRGQKAKENTEAVVEQEEREAVVLVLRVEYVFYAVEPVRTRAF